MQIRIDMIKRTFSKLPTFETERFGVDLSKELLVGTEEADKLISAWKSRQLEIKEAMSSIVRFKQTHIPFPLIITYFFIIPPPSLSGKASGIYGGDNENNYQCILNRYPP